MVEESDFIVNATQADGSSLYLFEPHQLLRFQRPQVSSKPVVPEPYGVVSSHRAGT